MTDYRPPTKQPCNDCPFRKKAMPGWLGEATPESFIECIQREQPLPCHQTIDYGDPAWKEKWISSEIGNTCAGALILSSNMGKLPRDRAFPRMPSDRENVFATSFEFLEYHNNAPVKSWEMGTTPSPPTSSRTSKAKSSRAKPRSSQRSRGKRA